MPWLKYPAVCNSKEGRFVWLMVQGSRAFFIPSEPSAHATVPLTLGVGLPPHLIFSGSTPTDTSKDGPQYCPRAQRCPTLCHVGMLSSSTNELGRICISPETHVSREQQVKHTQVILNPVKQTFNLSTFLLFMLAMEMVVNEHGLTEWRSYAQDIRARTEKAPPSLLLTLHFV